MAAVRALSRSGLRVLAGLVIAACNGGSAATPTQVDPAAAAPRDAPRCPRAPIADVSIPDVEPRHESPQTWLARYDAAARDEVLLTDTQRQGAQARWNAVPGGYRDPLDPRVHAAIDVARELEERIAFYGDALQAGRMQPGRPDAFERAVEVMRRAEPVDQARQVVREAPLFCIPTEDGIYRPPVDPDFDRNRCASLHPAEVVRVLRRGPQGRWLLVNAGHTTGWLHDPALSPAEPVSTLADRRDGPLLRSLRDGVRTEQGGAIRLGVGVAVADQTDTHFVVRMPTEQGYALQQVPREAPVAVGPVPLRRSTVFDIALSELGQSYGWGGRDGHRDCSRFLRDVFATFGVQLGRHSGVQAQQGTHNVDVAALDEDAKREAIHRWADQGVVLLYMPGHIMLYLGRDGEYDYAVSAISEYLEPCPGGPDTVFRTDRVAVTTLELGRDTERTAFIERITRLVVFAPESP